MDHARNYFNNYVFLNINKEINTDDYDAIVAYFQSNEDSNGDKIISHEYNKSSNKLMINYLKGSTKREILRRKQFMFRSYTFEACEVKPRGDRLHASYDKYDRVLMIENNNDHKIDNINKFLLPAIGNNNLIEKTVQSLICENVIFLKYKCDLNFEMIKQYHKSCLSTKGIQFYEAYETQSILVKVVDSCNLNEEYLNKHFKSENNMYWQVPLDIVDSPFVVVKFTDIDFKLKFLTKLSKEKGYLVENNFNLTFLHKYLDRLWWNKNKDSSSAMEIDEDENLEIISFKMENCLNEKLFKDSRVETFTIKCTLCPQMVPNRSQLQKHLETHKPKENAYKCRYCTYNTRNKTTVVIHERLHIKKE